MTPLPRLILVTDWRMPRERLLQSIDSALRAGPGIAVQHRQPGAPIRPFLDDARTLAELCARHRAPLFVNGRLDVAVALGVHLHLPAGGIVASEARPHLGHRLLSVAVHDAPEAVLARGADLALVSPVFHPGSKPDDRRTPLGADGFHALARQLECPAFALGGITAERIAELQPAGVAAVTAVLEADDPRAAAAAMLAALGRGPV